MNITTAAAITIAEIVSELNAAEASSTEITETTETTKVSIQEQVTRTATILERALDHLKSAVPSLIMALLVLIIGIIISRLIAGLVKRTMKRSNIDGAARSFLVSLVRIMLYMVVIIMALSVINVPMSSVITIFGAAGLAVSLALQNCLSNLCGGFIILFSKPFIAGDIIEIDGSVGTVDEISILYTKIRTFDGKAVSIPNGKVSDAKIINYTASPTRRIDLRFDIGYGDDYPKARTLILEVIGGNKKFLSDPEPIVHMTSHGESAVSIDVKVHVLNEDYESMRYYLLEAVKEKFDANGIEIPYKQVDVHIKDVIS